MKEYKESTSKKNEEKHIIFNLLLQSFYENDQIKSIVPNKEKIDLIPYLMIDTAEKNVKISFKIGINTYYQINNIYEFYNALLNNEKIKYGKNFVVVHTPESFTEKSKKILDFFMESVEKLMYAKKFSTTYSRAILDNKNLNLENDGIDKIFKILENQEVECNFDSKKERIKILNKLPKIDLEVVENNENEFKLVTKNDIYSYSVIQGNKKTYFIEDKKIYICSKEFEENTIKILNTFKTNYTNEIVFSKKDFENFYSFIYEKNKHISLEKLDEVEIAKYIPSKFIAKLFLDYDENSNLVAEIKFIYGEVEINPFEENDGKISRNAKKEEKILDLFVKSGFMLDGIKNRLMLVDDEKIFDFLTIDVEEYSKYIEVLVTEKFKNKGVIIPKVKNVGVKIENNLLNIDFSNTNFDKNEIEEIIKNYKLKKTFYRLKDGTFLNLQKGDLELIQKISETANVDYDKLLNSESKIPMHRGFYLEKILKELNKTFSSNSEYKNVINKVLYKEMDAKYDIPKILNAELREYQKIGFSWLKTLEEYGFGGILADDMGLGKTVQVLALVADYCEKNEKREPILIVCPSSLTLNWKEEIKKFTPSLKSKVISGTSENRKNLISNIKKYDIIITSYDLLKRDLEEYKENSVYFEYIIADEAQYIKNNTTKNAKAIKEIDAKYRFALTGTPIENSLAELWSIFDFIMPNYLYTYNKFKVNFETPIIKEQDKEAMQKLKSMIEPFVLRRIKEKVLEELPEKTITILKNEMNEEQQKIYISYLEQAKKEIKLKIETEGIEKNQIKILALLMRLRQICCHPGLFLENYAGESSKIEQCIEIIKENIAGNHKILLFSGYSSMFKYIEEKLKSEKIKYFKLTGDTKVENRMDLVNEFNTNDEIKIFLISLKAGGTGLNLIGADVVIHYDPWWNLSAENQATDRSYRIGQKKNVQVYKMITENSIEEKIFELQEKKAKLANEMLSMNETFISRLNKEEILELFE